MFKTRLATEHLSELTKTLYHSLYTQNCIQIMLPKYIVDQQTGKKYLFITAKLSSNLGSMMDHKINFNKHKYHEAKTLFFVSNPPQ